MGLCRLFSCPNRRRRSPGDTMPPSLIQLLGYDHLRYGRFTAPIPVAPRMSIVGAPLCFFAHLHSHISLLYCHVLFDLE